MGDVILFQMKLVSVVVPTVVSLAFIVCQALYSVLYKDNLKKLSHQSYRLGIILLWHLQILKLRKVKYLAQDYEASQW